MMQAAEIVEALLAGPRGRRMLLEFAFLVDPDEQPSSLWGTVLSAGRAFDTSGVTVWIGGTPDPEPAPATPTEVARVLDGIELPVPTALQLRSAMVRSVDAAMYWQGPDGTDQVAAQPVVIAALRRVAEHLAPHLGQWSEQVDVSRQYAAAWMPEDGERATPPPVPVSADALAQARETQLEEERRAQSELPTDPAANFSGTWWSTPGWQVPSSNGVTCDGSPAALWYVEDSMGWESARCYPTRVAEQARIFEITDAEDWADLCRRFPAEVTALRRHDWYRCTGRAGEWVQPDWAAVAENYDGVRLQPLAYLSAAGTAIPASEGVASVIAGWNPGETYWLTAAVVFAAPTTWVLSSDEEWRTDENSRDR